MKAKKQIPILRHLDEFKAVLKNYSPSRESQDFFSSVPMVILVGPTAAGRNTLINLLVATGRYHMIVSDTTRPPRMDNGKLEENGTTYWFKSEDDFLEGLKNGEYVEARLIHSQQVSGANIAEIHKAHDSGAIALKEIEINGSIVYRKFKPDMLCVFLLPPTFDIWMKRLRGRGHITKEELRRRLESAVAEISQALSLDYFQFVVNYEIHEAAVAVDEIANGRVLDETKQQVGRNHAEQLLIDVQLFLAAP
ncbi:hypothetical protein BH10PAT3_BH10PAT3_1400 [soil metagenome]